MMIMIMIKTPQTHCSTLLSLFTVKKVRIATKQSSLTRRVRRDKLIFKGK